jgi:O-antigen/teichoic acid export membrane protein
MNPFRVESRRLVANAVFNVAGHLTALGLAFVLSPILVAGLGDRRYGLWALVDSVLAYLLLFEGGTGASLVRYVAKFEELRERDQLNRLFSTTMALMLGAGAVVAATVAALALIPAHPLGVPDDLVPEARLALLVLGANLVLGLPLGVFPATLDGLGRFPAKVTVRVVCSVVQAIVLGLLCRGRSCDLPTVGLVITASNLVQFFLYALLVRRYLPGLRFRFGLVDRGTLRMIRGQTVSAFVVLVAARVSYQTDSLVIGAFLTLEGVTYFALASKLVEYSKVLFRAAFGVMTPAISKWETRGDLDAIRRAFLAGTRINLFLILPVQFGFWLLGRPFLELWLGPGYVAETFPVLAVLSAPLALALAQAVAGRVLYGMERIQGFAAVTVGEAVANLLLSLALVKPLGLVGVALGTAIPSVAASVAVTVYVCRLLNVGLAEYVAGCFLKPLAASLFPGLVWAAAAYAGAGRSWAEFVLLGAVGTAGHAALALALERRGRRPEPDAPGVVLAVTWSPRTTSSPAAADSTENVLLGNDRSAKTRER